MICALINGMQPTAIFENRFLRSGVLYTPLRRIVQLTNSDALRFRNRSFTNKKNAPKAERFISFCF